MRIFLYVVLIGLLLIVVGQSAADTPIDRKTIHIPLNADFTWLSTYDDNLFRHSERDLTRFEDGTETYHNPNSTWDDWRNDFGVSVALPWKHDNGWETRVEGSIKAAIHAVNHRKDYQRYAVSLRQTFGKTVWVQVSVGIVPKYYLRQYYDRDMKVWTECDYDSRTFEEKFRYKTPWRTYIYPFAQFKTLYYNRYFTEFDAEWTTFGVGVEQFLSRRWLVGGSYRFTVSDNVGGGGLTAASQINLMEDTEYGEGDFEEDEFRLSATYKPRKFLGKRWEFSLDGKLRLRYYITDNSIDTDPFHSGRKDTRWEVVSGASVRIMRHLWLSARYKYEERDTVSDESAVEAAKDFFRQAFTFGLKYEFRPSSKR